MIDKLTKYTVSKLKEIIKNLNSKLSDKTHHILVGKKKPELINEIMTVINTDSNLVSIIADEENKKSHMSECLKKSLIPIKKNGTNIK